MAAADQNSEQQQVTLSEETVRELLNRIPAPEAPPEAAQPPPPARDVTLEKRPSNAKTIAIGVLLSLLLNGAGLAAYHHYFALRIIGTDVTDFVEKLKGLRATNRITEDQYENYLREARAKLDRVSGRGNTVVLHAGAISKNADIIILNEEIDKLPMLNMADILTDSMRASQQQSGGGGVYDQRR